MKTIETYQWAVRWEKSWRMSPEYATVEEAHKNLLPFLKQFRGKDLQCTFHINVRYVSDNQGLKGKQ